ncbi:hypothetical protein EDC04DRAFT_2956644 [Pisolithus marmoratus]|nr:hypothetical protein EDC04DRAFT_2956644 [Pisolithus marmoratus]
MSSLPSGIPFLPLPMSNVLLQVLPSVPTLAPASSSNPVPSTVITPAPPTCPLTLVNNVSMSVGNASQQVLAAYILLSLASKASVDVLIDREHVLSSPSHCSKISHSLPFDLDDNAPVVTPDSTTLPISSLINNLADSGFHVPLSLFSYESLYKLQNQPLAVKTVKVHHKGQNVYILDITQFP